MKKMWFVSVLLAIPFATALDVVGTLGNVWDRILGIGSLNFLGVSAGVGVTALTRILIWILMFTIFFAVMTGLKGATGSTGSIFGLFSRTQAGIVAAVIATILSLSSSRITRTPLVARPLSRIVEMVVLMICPFAESTIISSSSASILNATMFPVLSLSFAVFIPCPPYNQLSGVEAHAADGTTDEWAGADADSAAVAAVFSGWFPSNLIGGVTALLVVNTQAATALDVDFTFVRAYINGDNTGDAGATQTSLTTGETTADNQIEAVDCSAGMDADFVKAGAPFGVAVDPDAGDFLVIGLMMRYTVV